MTAAIGRQVGITVNWWDGPDPDIGDELETPTGRAYRIDAVLRKRNGDLREFCCTVLGKVPAAARRYGIVWSSRKRCRP